jgi:2-aminoadipate transaminase
MPSSFRSASSLNLNPLLSRRARNAPEGVLLDGMDDIGGTVSFAFGFPDPASLPAEEVTAATARALATRGQAALQYGDYAGYSGLIEALLAKLERDQGIRASRENILITAGGSQAIALILDTLVDWGDTIISEVPTWLGAVQAFQNVGANVVSIPVADDGVDLDALDSALERLESLGERPKLIYVISNFQNPTGVSLSVAKRQALLELTRRAGAILVEDDAYFDLRYEGQNLPSIYSLDTSGTVVYMGTLSKTMGPGMRLGWLVGPPELIRRVAALKVDGATSVFGSHVAAEWLPEMLLPHVARLRQVYQRRRDLMLAALAQHMPSGTTWTVPEGGFFIWVTLPAGVDTANMLMQVRELGVEYLPGEACFSEDAGQNQLRLSFSFVDDDRIDDGIRIIGDVAKAELREARV